MTLVMCFIASFFSYARAQRALGTNAGNAPVIADTISANIVDGTANYFKIAAANLPAMVYYWPDSAFGPLPTLINVAGVDTVASQMVVEGCRMGWRWQLAAAASEQEVRCLYFSAHENATAEIRPYVCYSTGSDTTATACDSFAWKGKTYTQGGIYADTTINAAGCDSIITLYLTINHSTTGEETLTECDSLFWNGEWRKASGDYTYTTTNAAGCDSTVTLHLTIHHSVSVTLNDTAVCADIFEPYMWGDNEIIRSGTYTLNLHTGSGCDSIVTRRFTANGSTVATDYVTAYDSLVWLDGKKYTTTIAGTIAYLTNVMGCDSVVTLNLTMRHVQVRDTVSRSVCDSELPFEWYGKTCMASGLYSSDTIQGDAVNGVYMDTVYTVNLTVNETYAVDTTADVLALEFVWHGTSYTQNGDYAYKGQTVAGCDSIVTLHLTLTDPTPIDTIPAYFCPKSGIVEHVDVTSKPRIHYIPFEYEQPNQEWYMEDVVTDESNSGAYVDFLKAQQALYAYYVEPLMPVTVIYWRYRKRGASSQTEVEINRTQPQWIETGTISIEVQFQCGQRYYDSFTVGDMTEGTEQVSEDEQPIKRMENGQVVIIRNGEKYTILGTKIQ